MTQSARKKLWPPSLLQDGLDWHGKSSRTVFLVVTLLTLGIWAIAISLGVTEPWPYDPFNLRFAALGLLLLLFAGHSVRRLNDNGSSAWWAWLLLIPLVNWAVIAWLALAKPADTERHKSPVMRKIGLGFVCFLAALIASRMFWAPYWIPAGSMKPTLLIGDFVVVTPLRSAPERGDVVVFRHPVNGADFIKRLIGLPGDTVQLKDALLHINGTPVQLEAAGMFEEVFKVQGPVGSRPRCENDPVVLGGICQKTRQRETLPNRASHDILNIAEQRTDNTPALTVPPGHYFFMGDNRDNSIDSRFAQSLGGVGFVPEDHLKYRATFVLFSSAGKSLGAFWTWRADRFLRRVQ